MKRYFGEREGDGEVRVWWVDGATSAIMRPKTYPISHGAVPFNWGVVNLGAVQLALALLADATGNLKIGEFYSPMYSVQVVERLPVKKWSLSVSEILGWLFAQIVSDFQVGESGPRQVNLEDR